MTRRVKNLLRWLKKVWLKILSKIKRIFVTTEKMKNDKIINGNCWVACFDILGFRNKVLDFEQQYEYGRLNFFVKNYYREILAELKKEKRIFPDKVFTSWASDTFLMYTADDSDESFNCIAIEAVYFCVGVIRKNWPIRGALGTGQLYVEKENSIFVGSALIDSYLYSEKQNWIGLVITPNASKRTEVMGTDSWMCHYYTEYDVPMKTKKMKDKASGKTQCRKIVSSKNRRSCTSESLYQGNANGKPA